MSTEKSSRTFVFALVVCLVTSVVVSAVAVSLRGAQERNKTLDMQKNVLFAAGLVTASDVLSDEEIEVMLSTIRVEAVNLESGEVLPDFDVENYDQKKAGKDVLLSTVIPPKDDIALIKRRENVGLVYEVLGNSGEVERVVFPIKGYGLWSTLYGFLALSNNASTIEGITFYEHAETAGLGGEVDNVKWKAGWQGKVPYGENGEVAITVVKGQAGDNPHKVDGLSGATITARGVNNLVQFWLGEDGYGKYIKKYMTSGL